jgi:CBS domain-containing protein
MEDKVKQIFSKNVVTISENSTISEADAMMKKHEFRHLPVTNAEGYLSGIISRTDYMALVHLDMNLQNIKVKKLMSHPVKTFSINAPVRLVAQTFVNKKIILNK